MALIKSEKKQKNYHKIELVIDSETNEIVSSSSEEIDFIISDDDTITAQTHERQNFSSWTKRLESPALSLVKVVPDDNNDLPDGLCRGLLIGSEGSLTIHDRLHNLATDVPMQKGYNPIMVERVFATGAIASDIWAIY